MVSKCSGHTHPVNVQPELSQPFQTGSAGLQQRSHSIGHDLDGGSRVVVDLRPELAKKPHRLTMIPRVGRGIQVKIVLLDGRKAVQIPAEA